jgi:hypothetical protein
VRSRAAISLIIAELVASPAIAEPNRLRVSDPRECGSADSGYTLISPDGLSIPHNGGILMSWYGADRNSALSGIRYESAGSGTDVTIKSIAPGLVSISPRGSAELLVKTRTVRRYRFVHSDGGKLAPPAPVSIHKLESQAWGRPGIVEIRAEFSTAPPDGVVAVAFYVSDRGNNSPVGWAPVVPGDLSVNLYTTNDSCGHTARGARSVNLGEAVSFAWVDHVGRVSARSASVVVDE